MTDLLLVSTRIVSTRILQLAHTIYEVLKSPQAKAVVSQLGISGMKKRICGKPRRARGVLIAGGGARSARHAGQGVAAIAAAVVACLVVVLRLIEAIARVVRRLCRRRGHRGLVVGRVLEGRRVSLRS
jgi:hypothetical protein